MKKRIFLLISGLLTVALSVLAQPRLEREEMYVGAQGGAVASMVLFTPSPSPNMQPPLACPISYTAGVMWRVIAHKACGFQMELNYLQRGWKESNAEKQPYYRRQLDYITMPILSHFYFGKEARGYFEFGPQIGYLIRDTYQVDKTQPIASVIENAWTSGNSSTIDKQYVPVEKKFDWSVVGGLGFYYATRRAGAYQLGARFNFSLGTLFANSQMDYFSMSNNMNLAITFAYMWDVFR